MVDLTKRPPHEERSQLIPPWWFAQRMSDSTGRFCSILDPLTMVAWHQVNEIAIDSRRRAIVVLTGM